MQILEENVYGLIGDQCYKNKIQNLKFLKQYLVNIGIILSIVK